MNEYFNTSIMWVNARFLPLHTTSDFPFPPSSIRKRTGDKAADTSSVEHRYDQAFPVNVLHCFHHDIQTQNPLHCNGVGAISLNR